jgi:hypothetical protein
MGNLALWQCSLKFRHSSIGDASAEAEYPFESRQFSEMGSGVVKNR